MNINSRSIDLILKNSIIYDIKENEFHEYKWLISRKDNKYFIK